MGKRKSRTSKLLQPKKAPKLDTDFTCPFCNHPGAVQCRVFLKPRRPYAVASCSVCNETYATKANALTEPIDDVYSEWIDSCEEEPTRASSSAGRAWAKPRKKTEDDTWW